MFALAIEQAPSDAARADLYYSQGSSRYGSVADFRRALDYAPNHGPALYRLAGLVGESVGRPRTTSGQLAYWCLADLYRDVAARTGRDPVSASARRVAAQYERAAPSPEEIAELGLVPGATILVNMGEAGTCTTTVR